jgi:uncharacterized protein YjbI with pentapeptide repeats
VRLVKDSPFEVAWFVWPVRPPRPRLTVVVKATFELVADGECPIAAEQALPCGDENHGDETESLRYESDLAPFKPRGECLVIGTYRPPPGAPVRSAALGFRIGPVQKQLALWGDRHYTPLGSVSDAAPIQAIPLRWERAFGGPAFDDNPHGRGIARVEVEGKRVVLLPNVERPEGLAGGSPDQLEPAACWPVPRTFPARAGLMGSYDASWLKKRWPWFPEDFDWRYFNAAPPDQQITGFFRGDEQIQLLDALPDAPVVRCRLPGLRPRVLVEADAPAGAAPPPLHLLAPDLDTITVDLDARRVICLWRCGFEVDDESLAGIRGLFVAHERLDAPARAPAEDRAALDQVVAASEDEGAAAEAPAGPPPPPLPSLDPAALAALRAELVEARAAGSSCAGRVLAGADLSELDLGGLDLSNAVLTGASLRGARLDGARLDGANLLGADLTGASLRATSLAGADLTGCRGPGLSFEETQLDDAQVSEAGLAGARFVRASLRRADLSRAALGGATFEDCELSEADLSGARLDDAVLTRCRLVDASLAGASAQRARMDGCELGLLRGSGALDLSGASLRGVKAAGARFRGARLDGANLSLALLDDANFSEASLVGALLLGCQMRQGRFDRARLLKAQLAGSDLYQASFEGADLRGADLRGASLYGAELWKADLDGAQLETADLAGTKLAKA